MMAELNLLVGGNPSHSQPAQLMTLGMQFFILIPESWKRNFSEPFLFSKFQNGLKSIPVPLDGGCVGGLTTPSLSQCFINSPPSSSSSSSSPSSPWFWWPPPLSSSSHNSTAKSRSFEKSPTTMPHIVDLKPHWEKARLNKRPGFDAICVKESGFSAFGICFKIWIFRLVIVQW